MMAIAVMSGCGSGVRLPESVVSTPSKCPEVEVLGSGDVKLCHHLYAHWTGTELDRDGQPLFVVNRGQITAGGRVVAKADGDDIAVFLREGTPDKHIRVKPSGKVVDENGDLVATISPAPDGDLPTLVFAALIREGVWLPALPPEKQRVSALKVQVIDGERHDAPPAGPCSCGAESH